MVVSDSFLDSLLDQLSEFWIFTSIKMFGGVGIFHQGLMFGMIGNDVFRLKIDQTNQSDYEKMRMQPYHSGKK